MKDKGSSPENIVQGINRAMTGVSSVNVDYEVDDSNGESEYNS